MTNPITRNHRLSVARAWEGGQDIEDFRTNARRWAQTGLVIDSDSGGLERLAQLVADAEGAWVPVDEWPEDAGWVAIGHDVFYGRIGEVERRPGTQRWVFIDEQKDDCDVTMVRPLPKPPEQP